MSLHAKLGEVMAEAGRIPKNGTAPAQMGGYAFVQVGDAADAIRKALGERGVSMLPSSVEVISESEHQTSKGGTMTTQTIRTTWTLTDGESGETAVIQSLGTGADTGDKFSPKAQTNAMKYALLMGFLLSTGDDPEAASTPERGPKVKPQQSPAEEPVLEQMSPLRDGNATLHGTVAAGKTATTDLFLREAADGYALGFVLVSETRGRTQVLARDVLAQDIWDAIGHDGGRLYGKEVTVEGELTHVPWEKDGRAMKPYKQLALRKLTTPEWVLPDEPPDEAESLPLFESEPVA